MCAGSRLGLMEPTLVRNAVVGDEAALARVHLDCWRETYQHILSPAFLAGQNVEDRQAMWERALNGPGAARQFVAEAGGVIVGFAGTKPPSTEWPDKQELWGLYLLKAHHGSGLGQQLLQAAIGNGGAVLWVAEDNPRAHAFYRRNGFTLDGERKLLEEWEDLPILHMVR
ncbi:MAG: family N-acetyltransferase [Micrococcaceae bacterium]|nr:family N-acetyltransferase [Micrococcaceae bacterium]